jgi:redox-sensitive bicupin YhaK (pirin superfamily)
MSMAYTIRRSGDRKFFDHGWLKTRHTFSFGSYYDPEWMGYRDLRVINEDRVDPGHGFPPHDHRDMEILSLVLEGELAHKDSMQNQSVIHPNELQVMSAGSGVTHSEFNPSDKATVHFLQIWIIPETKGLKPGYQQVTLQPVSGEWQLLASKKGPLQIQQDVSLYQLTLEAGKQAEKSLSAGRYGWLQLIEGELTFDGTTLKTGDAVALEGGTTIRLQAQKPLRLLFFDLK